MKRRKIADILRKLAMDQGHILPPVVDCSEQAAGSMNSYSMSLELLDHLGSKALFDSHCHVDFIKLWRLGQSRTQVYEEFLIDYPLMNHPSLEGFITNFCSPKIWLDHLVSQSSLVNSLLSHPGVYYTLGCHPHFANDLSFENYKHLENLVIEAGPNCVAIGECGLDTSGKNQIKMSDQLAAFKMQVILAIRLRKTIVLHIRGAEGEALRALEDVGLPHDWPIHRLA